MVEVLVLEEVDEVGSTSEVLKARVAAGELGECALLARRQTGGRGRMGRPWHSIEGNLLLSILLRPTSLRHPGHWSILSAVALAETVRPYLPEPGLLRLKWPNDALLQGGKLAGILLEAGTSPTPWLVIGFGVNLVRAPDDLERKVACLADWSPAPAAPVFARQLLAALQGWRARYVAEGFAPVQAAWLDAAHSPGERIVASVGKTRVEGTFRGLGDDGSLLLDGPAGEVAIPAGELA